VEEVVHSGKEHAVAIAVAEPYRDRTVRPLGIRDVEGWRLKVYEIAPAGRSVHLPLYEDGFAVAVKKLPQPPVAPRRAGVGFATFHEGSGVHYLLLCWWDRDSELFSRLMVRGIEEDDLWVWAQEHEMAGAWELQVVGFERDAWVDTVLSRPGDPNIEGYLERTLTIEAEA
jgi:hypothetical protein